MKKFQLLGILLIVFLYFILNRAAYQFGDTATLIGRDFSDPSNLVPFLKYYIFSSYLTKAAGSNIKVSFGKGEVFLHGI